MHRGPLSAALPAAGCRHQPLPAMAKQLRQARAVARAASNWVRHDLREILFPSSIPTPPGIEEEHKQQSKREWAKVRASLMWHAALGTS